MHARHVLGAGQIWSIDKRFTTSENCLIQINKFIPLTGRYNIIICLIIRNGNACLLTIHWWERYKLVDGSVEVHLDNIFFLLNKPTFKRGDVIFYIKVNHLFTLLLQMIDNFNFIIAFITASKCKIQNISDKPSLVTQTILSRVVIVVNKIC